jgi:hypothetical protein
LKASTAAELQNLNFEFVASLECKAATKEAKANAVVVACTDAEMDNGTKNVDDKPDFRPCL